MIDDLADAVTPAGDWDHVHSEALAHMTPDERAEMETYELEVRARRRLAELVYGARTRAGLTQAELAERAGTTQPLISAIENAAQAPGGVMLMRIADALGLTLGFTNAA